jgi:hypothetical protein
VEHPARNVIEQMTFELKINDEINLCRVTDRAERPRICQVLERPIDGLHEHLFWSVEGDLARETFLERAEPDDKFGDDLALVLAPEMRTAAPGNERGIILYVSNDREQLLGVIMERRPFLMMRHVT